jgi:replicative DNA helicase
VKAVALAERATLAALLHDHAGAGLSGPQLARWLRPEDFADPWHREVYRAHRALAAAGGPAGAQEVGEELVRRVGATRADVVRVAGLLRDTPVGTATATYAVMVLEAALRREVAGQGVVLRAGALQSAMHAAPRAMNAVIAVVDAALDDAADRWAAATGQPPVARPEVPPRLRGSVARLDAALAADRFLAAHPAVSPKEVAEHEASLIAALLTHPHQLHAAACWLRPASLTNRAWRPVYEAMLHLHAYGHPIDPVTVLWETQRSSRRAGPGPDPRVVTAKVEAALPEDPGHWGRVVAADHLRLTADHAAESLRAAAANPGLDVVEVFGTGHRFTEALRAAARPLAPTGPARLASVHQLPTPHSRRAGPVAG